MVTVTKRRHIQINVPESLINQLTEFDPDQLKELDESLHPSDTASDSDIETLEEIDPIETKPKIIMKCHEQL